MKTYSPLLYLGLFCATFGAAAAQTQCTKESPAYRLAVVELYTSEGCSSCPPAERWIGSSKAIAASGAVALAFHVNYWDYLGWKDAYAKPIFTARQRWLTAISAGSSVYTPGVFVNGKELANWSNDSALQAALARTKEAIPGASIRVSREPATGNGPAVAKITAVLSAATAKQEVALYVGTTLKPFTNKVSAGENSGEVLQHAHVVDQWISPVSFGTAANASAQVALNEKTSAVVALVQDTKSGKILQAFAAGANCEN
jgi:hypothetical protein